MQPSTKLRAGILALALTGGAAFTGGVLGAASPAAASPTSEHSAVQYSAAPTPAPATRATTSEKTGSGSAVTSLALTAPEATEQIWVDLEHPGIRAETVRAEFLAPQETGWSPLALTETAFGLSLIVPAEPGPYLFRVTTSQRGITDVVITAATGTGTVLATARERLVDEPGGGATDGSGAPAPGQANEPGSSATPAGNSGADSRLSRTGTTVTAWALVAALFLGAGTVLGLRASRARRAHAQEIEARANGADLSVAPAPQPNISAGKAPEQR